jgi:hypothetical protein
MHRGMWERAEQSFQCFCDLMYSFKCTKPKIRMPVTNTVRCIQYPEFTGDLQRLNSNNFEKFFLKGYKSK